MGRIVVPLADGWALRPPWPRSRRWRRQKSADPLFAAVEAHKAAWARLLETEDRTDDFDALEAFHALEAGGGAVDAAFEKLTQTARTKRAGMGRLSGRPFCSRTVTVVTAYWMRLQDECDLTCWKVEDRDVSAEILLRSDDGAHRALRG
jgi:hypothetical protein